MRWLAVITLLTTITPGLSAQRTPFGAQHFPGRSNPQPGFVNGFGRPAFAHHDRGFGGAFYYPLFSDALYDDYAPNGYPAASPPVVVVQSPMPTPAPVATPSQPLMIELQGDRYVQVSGQEASGAQMIDRGLADTGRAGKPVPAPASPPSQKEAIPTVLVFRDGHHEQVAEYTITNGVMYAPADYYSSGSWNRTIELSALNLPETVQFNQSRGVRFQLPSAPNEVIVGP